MTRSYATLDRRGWLRGSALGIGAAAGSLSGWLHALAADAPRGPVKSVVVLWLNGGPATIDLWDLKPGHANGGPFKEIATTAAGLRISEHLPGLARHGKHLAVVRSLTTREGDHGRASHLLRTGYAPQGAIQFPAVGALVARELGSEASDLPGFVSIAPPRYALALGAGYLGPKYAPLGIGESAEGGPAAALKVPDLARPGGVDDVGQAGRLELLGGLERRFAAVRTSSVAESIRSAADRAVRLMRPEAAAAFDLDAEKPRTREAYGPGQFGQGVLLAHRLVERGVPFVEVTLDGWDTHQNNFDRVKELSAALDRTFSSLLADLQDRGLLASTLVVCQGEFGRTPRINGQAGRDHWPASWAVALAGGGVRTGQAVGKTSPDGATVVEKPVGVPDLVATVARAAGIDPRKQHLSNVGRPIRIAAPTATPIGDLL